MEAPAAAGGDDARAADRAVHPLSGRLSAQVLMPVYSPLPLRAIASGVRAALSGGVAGRARAALRDTLRRGEADREVLLLDSGTSALTLALKLTNGSAKRPAAIPAFACYDIATAVDGADAPFVFYDTDPRTLGPDLASLRRALEAGADRVVVVHLFGLPVDLDAVGRLAAEFGAVLIEDAAQGVGGSWRGTPLGSVGSLGVFSFGRGKGLTGGSGGALVGNDALGRRLVREWASRPAPNPSSLREVVAALAQSILARPSLYWIPARLPFLALGETHYKPVAPIREMTDFAAGVLRVTVELEAAESAARRERAALLDERLRASGKSTVTVPDAGVAGFLRFPMLLDQAHGGRATLAMRRAGTMPSYPCALPDLEGFGKRTLGAAREFPGARELAEHLVTMPAHSRVPLSGVTKAKHS